VFDFLRSLLGAEGVEPPTGDGPPTPDALRTSAGVLLLELAWADEEFSTEERRHLAGVLQRHFGLGKDDAEQLLGQAEAERSRAVDLWQYTTMIREHYSMGQKMVLAEAMWGLVYADGVLSSHEDYLIRRMSHLLGIKPGYLSQARKNWRGVGETGEDEDPGVPAGE
jgi:uncharacterized tellurite resistance protein B-like protein